MRREIFLTQDALLTSFCYLLDAHIVTHKASINCF